MLGREQLGAPIGRRAASVSQSTFPSYLYGAVPFPLRPWNPGFLGAPVSLTGLEQRSEGIVSRQEQPSAARWVCEDRPGIRSLRSQGQGMSVGRQGFLREIWWPAYLLQAQAHSNSLWSGLPVPPRCPKTGLEPLTLGAAARWSPGAPPPLGFQGADWPAGQPVPHHAPWESS